MVHFQSRTTVPDSPKRLQGKRKLGFSAGKPSTMRRTSATQSSSTAVVSLTFLHVIDSTPWRMLVPHSRHYRKPRPVREMGAWIMRPPLSCMYVFIIDISQIIPRLKTLEYICYGQCGKLDIVYNNRSLCIMSNRVG